MQGDILPFKDEILGTFAALWGHVKRPNDASSFIAPATGAVITASPDTCLKSKLVRALSAFVHILRPSSSKEIHFLCDVVKYCIDPKNSESLYLLHPGLNLWRCLVVNGDDALNKEVAFTELFGYLHDVIQQESSPAVLTDALRITTSYVLLLGDSFISTHGRHLSLFLEVILGYFLQHSLGGITDIHMYMLTHITVLMDLILQTCPQNGASLLDAWLPKMYDEIAGNQQTAQVRAQWICVFARVVITHEAEVINFLMQRQDKVQKFFDEWCDLHDTIGSIYMRKLSILAMLMIVKNLKASNPENPLIPQLINIAAEGSHAEESSSPNEPQWDKETLLASYEELYRMRTDTEKRRRNELDTAEQLLHSGSNSSVLVCTGAEDDVIDLTDPSTIAGAGETTTKVTEEDMRRNKLQVQDPVLTVSLKQLMTQHKMI
eukprot:TRINITY_DN51826_c0_g3_i1.p1 TRINITY_DN51826_c0_g3~~TRINITY_DN51826_c0_g3_i1.p1  ORF type:complete len:450 (-),score=43.25 TRINITY_DN51826_c0_g3_i1:238-1539(-)